MKLHYLAAAYLVGSIPLLAASMIFGENETRDFLRAPFKAFFEGQANKPVSSVELDSSGKCNQDLVSTCNFLNFGNLRFDNISTIPHSMPTTEIYILPGGMPTLANMGEVIVCSGARATRLIADKAGGLSIRCDRNP